MALEYKYLSVESYNVAENLTNLAREGWQPLHIEFIKAGEGYDVTRTYYILLERTAPVAQPAAQQPVTAQLASAPAARSIDDVLMQGNYVILDTETTGLERGEICSIAIIDDTGKVLLSSLVKTKNPIPADASRIHGLYDHTVEESPTFPELLEIIKQAVAGRDVVVYNAVYDRKMLHQSAEVWGLPKTEWKELSNWHCAMERFAIVFGDWNDYRQSYRWKKLTEAVDYYQLPIDGAHNALGDCKMTLAVCQKMAEGFRQEAGE